MNINPYILLSVLELGDDFVQSMLHAVGEVERSLSNLVDSEVQNLSDVLKCGLVSLARLVCLRSAHQRLNVVGLVLKHGCRVRDGAIEVRKLLVGGGSVAVDLDSEIGALI